MKLLSPAILLAVVLEVGRPTAATADTTAIDFESADVGKTPAGFTVALTGGGGPATWVIQADSSATSGSKVLVQTSQDTTSNRFPLCVYDSISAKDVVLSVRFKPISGSVDQAAGLVWRYQDERNYYIVRANALEGNVVLYKVQDGKRTDLKPVGAWPLTYGKKAVVPSGQWSSLKVEVRKNRFSVSINGAHLFDVEDDTFTASGKTGLWTKADSVTAFDEFTAERVDNP